MAEDTSSEEIDWIEEAQAFDVHAAILQSRIIWLKLAHQFRSVAGSFEDFLDDPSSGDQAMAWAARAEACFWRATGDLNAIDVDRFVPEIRPTPTPEPHHD